MVETMEDHQVSPRVTVTAGNASALSNSVSGSGSDQTKNLSSGHDVEVCEDVMVEEQSHWNQTAGVLRSDPFLHHVNNYTNWYNNSHQIVLHESRHLIKPQALTTITCAYGNSMAPKLVKCLEDSNLHVRQKALLWIIELAATAEGRAHCIKAGMLEALAKHFHEEDLFIKQLIAVAAGHFAGMQDACITMSHLGMIKWLLRMVSSSDDKLRESSLRSLLNATFNEIVRLELVHGELILDFLMKTSMEIVCDRCATLGLKILRRCLAGGTDKLAISKLLYINAIPTLLDLLKSTNEELQESSLRLLGLLSMDNEGKSQAQSSLGIEACLKFLKDDNLLLQTAATAALMSLTINIKAKKDFIGRDGIPSLVPYIDSSCKILSFNSLQLTANIAEDPNGRHQLQNQITKVHHLLDRSHSEIQKRFSKAALRQLKFKHRPYS